MELSEENPDVRLQIEDESGEAFDTRLETPPGPEEGAVLLNIQELKQFNNHQDSETDGTQEEENFNYNDYVVTTDQNNVDETSEIFTNDEAGEQVVEEEESEENDAVEYVPAPDNAELENQKRHIIKAVIGIADQLFFSSSSSSDDEDFEMLRLLYLKQRKRLVKRRKKIKKEVKET